jgi:hypothetical protein
MDGLPTPNPSQEGNLSLSTKRLIPLLGGVRGGLNISKKFKKYIYNHYKVIVMILSFDFAQDDRSSSPVRLRSGCQSGVEESS